MLSCADNAAATLRRDLGACFSAAKERSAAVLLLLGSFQAKFDELPDRIGLAADAGLEPKINDLRGLLFAQGDQLLDGICRRARHTAYIDTTKDIDNRLCIYIDYKDGRGGATNTTPP